MQVGSKVMLRSGGPHMTVTVVHEDDGRTCKWWDGTSYRSVQFAKACLTAVRGKQDEQDGQGNHRLLTEG